MHGRAIEYDKPRCGWVNVFVHDGIHVHQPTHKAFARLPMVGCGVRHDTLPLHQSFGGLPSEQELCKPLACCTMPRDHSCDCHAHLTVLDTSVRHTRRRSNMPIL
eukprot:3498448-Amphidinium_carterae.1